MYDIIFYIFALLTVVSAAVVVFVRNVAHAAFALMFTLFGVAGIFVLLGADFVGVSQLLIYVGGILVLFLFGMMLTANIDRLNEEATPTLRLLGATVASSAMLALLLNLAWSSPQWLHAAPRELPQGKTTALIGQLFMGDYALLFIASSVAILVALVGAAMIARSDRTSAEEAAERL